MNKYQSGKPQLMRFYQETKSKNLSTQIKALFKRRQKNDFWDELPDEAKAAADEGLIPLN